MTYPEPWRPADNGILARIDPVDLNRAGRQLADPESAAKGEVRDTELTLPDGRRVRFTFGCMEARHHKHRHKFWSCSRAVEIEEPAQPSVSNSPASEAGEGG